MEIKKIPYYLYLGIKFEMGKYHFFEKIINVLKTENDTLLNMIGDIKAWYDPNDYHITTFFAGRCKKDIKKKNMRNSPKILKLK